MSEQVSSMQEATSRERIKAVRVNAERRRAEREEARRDPVKYVVQLSQRPALAKSEVRWLEDRGLGGYLSGIVTQRLTPQLADQVLANPEMRRQLHETR